MDTQDQNKKQYDWLRGYQFVKGQSGNPGGRPKGVKSLKQFAREYLESLPDDEKVEYLRTLPTADVWKMAEGNPKQDTESSGTQQINIIIPQQVAKAFNINGTDTETIGGDTE